MAKFLYINNAGGGFAENREVPDGATIGDFFMKEISSYDAGGFEVRVNRDIVQKTYVIQDDDTVTVTPVNVKGAF